MPSVTINKGNWGAGSGSNRTRLSWHGGSRASTDDFDIRLDVDWPKIVEQRQDATFGATVDWDGNTEDFVVHYLHDEDGGLFIVEKSGVERQNANPFISVSQVAYNIM